MVEDAMRSDKLFTIGFMLCNKIAFVVLTCWLFSTDFIICRIPF